MFKMNVQWTLFINTDRLERLRPTARGSLFTREFLVEKNELILQKQSAAEVSYNKEV